MRSLPRAPPRVAQHEPVQEVVAGEREPLGDAQLARLLESEGGRNAELEAEPHDEPVRRTRPGPPPQALGKQRERDPTPGAVGPVHQLDCGTPAVAGPPPDQSVGALLE